MVKHDYTDVKNIYIICGKTDMRKGIDGLATLIQDFFELDPYGDSIFSYLPDGRKIDINVCISMGMASPCSINDWTMVSYNGLKMNKQFVIYLRRSSGGCLRGYPFSSQRPFNHRQKARSELFLPIFPLFQGLK
ncbi:transposase [Bacillus aquiflavi]|nr:transposase [Bacillus aquiflavi]